MIKILSDDTIQKIAAGEVIESPSSIIKELVENSIDAKANEIFVEIKNGGKSYIKVSDNGTGIEKDQVELAFVRHATSKIDDFMDLYKIFSMGFRGEALASIIAVSKVSISTKTENSSIGINIIYENNKKISSKNIGMNRGTIIEVMDLFENIPVRKKFLNSEMSEGNKITSLMYNFAVGNPNISFTYIRDNREIFKTNKKNQYIENLSNILSKDFTKNIIKFEEKSHNYSIKGYISNTNFYKGNRNMQYIYVNHRYIKNEKLRDEIEKIYTFQIPKGRFPAFIIFIDTKPKNIDINISPNKQKIKFEFEEELINLLKISVEDSINEFKSPKNIEIREYENEIVNFANLNQLQSLKRVIDAYHKPVEISLYDEKIKDDKMDIEYIYEEDEDLVYDEQQIILSDEKEDKESVNFELQKQDSFIIDLELNFNSVIFKRFLLFENDDKLTIIDKNRAYERIYYDRFKNKNIQSQDLIYPIIVNLNNSEIQNFKNNKEVLSNLGFEIDYFGETTIALRSVPYIENMSFNESDFRSIIDNLNSNEINKNINEIIKKISIASAKNFKIKNEEQAIQLYKDLLNCNDSTKSPSGLPIIYYLTIEEFLKVLK